MDKSFLILKSLRFFLPKSDIQMRVMGKLLSVSVTYTSFVPAIYWYFLFCYPRNTTKSELKLLFRLWKRLSNTTMMDQ